MDGMMLDDVVDESLIAAELNKLLGEELPATTSAEQRQLYQEIERRIALENQKLFAEKNASGKRGSIGQPMKAKLLAASSLARSRAELKARREAAKESEASSDLTEKKKGVKDLGADLTSKYRLTRDSLRGQLRQEGVTTRFQSDSDSDDADEAAGEVEHSPLNKLKRSIRRAKVLSRFEKSGLQKQEKKGDDSDEEMRAVREESEEWLKKQKVLEKQLLGRVSKGALRTRYMRKGAEVVEDVPATEKRIEDLLDRVVRESGGAVKRGGRGGDKKEGGRGGGGRGRSDMAEVVKRALALRQEAESKGVGGGGCAKRTARKPFPVRLDTSDEDTDESEAKEEEESEDLEESEEEIKGYDMMPELDTSSESSDEVDAKEYRKRTKGRYDLMGDTVDDVAAMEEAKRKLGRKPELWSSKPPGYGKFDAKSRPGGNGDRAKLIDTFPPEVEALRAKLALGEFGMSNRELLESRGLVSDKQQGKGSKEDANKLKTSSNDDRQRQLKSHPKTPTSREQELPSRNSKMLTKQQSETKLTVKPERKSRLGPQTDPVRSMLQTRRPSLGTGRSASKLI